MKKLMALILLLSLLCMSAAMAAETKYGPAVVDNANIISASDELELTQTIEQIREKYQIDGVVLTVNLGYMSDRQLEDYADRFFEDYGYGIGEDRAGFVLMIDTGNRYLHISTAGVMIDYLEDDRIEDCLDAGYDAFHLGNYGSGSIRTVNKIEEFLARGIREGQFRFDRETGKRLSGLYNKLTAMEAMMAILAGAAVMFFFTKSVKSSYALEHNTYEFNRSTQSNVKIDREEEHFLRENVTRHRKNTGSSGSGSSGGGHHGGSSVHVSSGGMSHGGGGRHF